VYLCLYNNYLSRQLLWVVNGNKYSAALGPNKPSPDGNAVKIHCGSLSLTSTTNVTGCRPCSHRGSPKTRQTQKQVTNYLEETSLSLLLNRHLHSRHPLNYHPISQETMLFLDVRLMNSAYPKWMRAPCSTSATIDFPLRHPMLVVLAVDLDELQQTSNVPLDQRPYSIHSRDNPWAYLNPQ
jgi:hypothetical protein